MAQTSYKLIGVEFGTYEGNNWGRLHLLEPFGSGSQAVGYREVKKDYSKCDYLLAVNIMKEWELYENQEVYASANLRGRIDRVDLVN